MKTKNFILRSLLCLMFAFSAVLFVACDKVKPTSIEIVSGVPDAIYQGAELDLTNIKVKVVYDDNTFKTVGLADVTYTFDSSTVGAQELVVTLKDSDISTKVNIIVVEQGGNLDAKINALNSGLITGRHADSFVHQTNNLVAGDDNDFDLQLNATSTQGQSYTDIETDITVEMLDAEGNFVTVETPATYLTSERNKVHFTSQAVGKTFRLTVAAKYYNKIKPSFKLVVDVVDGYNVYEAKDLSVITNMDQAQDGEDYGWKQWKETYSKYKDVKVNAVVFQNDINLKDGDIPSYYFWTQAEVDAEKEGGRIEADSTNLSIVGSMKDDSSMALFRRDMKAGENFAVYGNYFTLNIEDLSKTIVGCKFDEFVSYYDENSSDKNTQITSHTSLFKFNGTSDTSKLNINDLSVRGNSKRTTDTRNSGGVLLAKIQGLNSEVKNCSYSNCYIGFMFERTGNEDVRNEIEDKLTHKLIDTTGYDSYNSLLYFWGVNKMLIEGGEYIGAGGPVMIVDHVDNNKASGEGGNPTNIDVIGTKLESLVTGNEPWFISYGAGALVPQIKANNAEYQKHGSTFLQKKDNIADLMNLKVVYKSGDAEGISASVVRGKVAYYNNRAEFEQGKGYALDMTEYSKQASAAKKNMFQNSSNGEHMGSTTYLLIPDNLTNPQNELTATYVVKLTDIEGFIGALASGGDPRSFVSGQYMPDGKVYWATGEASSYDMVDTNITANLGGSNMNFTLKTFVVNSDNATGDFAAVAQQGVTNINCYLFNGMAIVLELYKAN